jgi:hypothetical protein
MIRLKEECIPTIRFGRLVNQIVPIDFIKMGLDVNARVQIPDVVFGVSHPSTT